MGCGSWDAAARRRWAKVARIGYAIRQARRNRARVPHLEDRQLQSADTSDSLPVESKFQADAVGVDTAPAASKHSALPWVGRSLPPSRKQPEEWERRAAPALFAEASAPLPKRANEAPPSKHGRGLPQQCHFTRFDAGKGTRRQAPRAKGRGLETAPGTSHDPRTQHTAALAGADVVFPSEHAHPEPLAEEAGQSAPGGAPRLEAWLEDLSQNGTFINGKLVGRDEKQKLKDGDRIELVFPRDSSEHPTSNVNHFPTFTYHAPQGGAGCSTQETVMKYFTSYADDETEIGCTISDCVNAVAPQGVTDAQVRAAVEALVNVGYLYSTIDDEHYRMTQ